ncbi:chromatin modification-related protein EAF1 B-like protein isoform X1 [Tanacetum coccineum]|uniref:Chromatin modification-related protein EAF1 B-like protein isoform X1 n=1 Tax=Tanacetum coccineum TaxID=301880 RepID=A0ABQ5B6P1_9ASTR
MHGCTSGIALVVNAELDSMGGVGISSTPSLQQSSDLEKTQAELRQTFSAAEKFRRELEFLQSGGDPLDLKPANAASVSFQSTSPIERHPEQFVTSEAKGSSAESSGRLGAPSVCEPNSADNLMLFDGDSKSNDLEKRSTILELPKKSYRRRVRSRPSRSSSTDAFRHVSNDSSSKPKSPNANVDLKNSVSHLENDLDGMPAVQSSLGPAHGPYSGVLNVNDVQNTRENHHDLLSKSDGRDAPLTMASTEPESVLGMEQAHLTDSKRPLNADIEVSESPFPGPANGFGNTEEIKSRHDDSKSSCIQNSRRFDNYNGPLEQNLKGNDVGAEKNDKLLNIDKDSSDICHSTQNKDGSAMKEEGGVKGSESALHADFNNSVRIKETERKTSILVGPNSLSQDENACSSRPQGLNDTHFQESTDGAEQNACSQDNLKLATKEREDSILEEARIIEAKRKRIAELSARPLPLEGRLKSHWDFVLEEMSWLANDFAQERLWKVTAAAQISRRAAFASHLRLQRQVSVQKQKEVSHTLAEAVLQFWHMIQMKCKGQESHNHIKDHEVGIQRYAMKFVKHNSSEAEHNATQAPVTHDSISDLGIMDHSWEDNLTEENLFYQVPPGAIEAYRKAIDSHLLQFEVKHVR